MPAVALHKCGLGVTMWSWTLVVIAGERAKNIKTGGLKKCKNFTAQHAVRKMQTTRQQSAILKFEWAAIIFSCSADVDLQPMWNNSFSQIIALLSIAVVFASNKLHQWVSFIFRSGWADTGIVSALHFTSNYCLAWHRRGTADSFLQFSSVSRMRSHTDHRSCPSFIIFLL